jgi:putative hydrolase of the HAD superfamily
MIKCIIFDIGGVLLDFYDNEYYGYLAKLSKRSKAYIEKKLDPLNARLDLGIIRTEYFEKKISELFHVKKNQVRLLEFYKEHARVNTKMVGLTEKLHKKYRIAVLSNVGFEKYDVNRRMIDYSKFDYRFLSCYMELRKPDPEIFRCALRKMRLRSDQVIFIDNQIENVLSARSVGIRSILFKSYKQLCNKFIELGML